MKKENEKEKKEYPLIGINLVKSKTQKLINIEGISIYFPFEPYPSQIAYMKNVILTLNKEESLSALESPTGTGKTLCLLCAVLAWIKHNNKQISIYYCTRTVSQINNVLKELNKTCYEINISFLTSRKHTCIQFTKNKRKKMEHSILSDICETFRNNYWKMKREKENEKSKLFENENEEEIDDEIKKKKRKKKIINLPICDYYREESNYHNFDKNNDLTDIEDLLKIGKKHIFCPYLYNIYKTRKCANLTIMTYNYMIDAKIREKLDIIEKNSIVILDEAHNICDNLENVDSKKINMNDLKEVQELLQIFLDFITLNRKNIYKEDEDINPLLLLDYKDINNEIKAIKNFINDMNGLDLNKIKRCKKYNLYENTFYICDIEFFKEKFKNFNSSLYEDINKKFNTIPNEYKKEFNNFYLRSEYYDRRKILSKYMKLLRKISDFLIHLKIFYIPQNNKITSDNKPAAPVLLHLKEQDENIINNLDKKEDRREEEILDIKRKIEGDDINSFRFIIKKHLNEITFDINSLDASYGFKEFLKINPHCTILTSGTLSIKTIKNLLKVNFYKELNNNHVISNNQFMLNIITEFELNNIKHDYSFIYDRRHDITQVKSLGNEIYNLANSVTVGGILVFFQSFDYLHKCYKVWLSEGIVKKFNKIKDSFFDLEFNKKFSEELIMEKKKKNNLLLFTVYRGKNSEGINFSNDEARMVICVGVPYPKLSDIKVNLKREFLTQRCKKERNGFDGHQWYTQEAMNAVNQSLGRLIRNVNDYGIMICFGIEFLKVSQYFCKWIKSNVRNNIKLKENDNKFYKRLNDFLINLRYLYNNDKNTNNKKDEMDEESLDDFREERELNNEENDDDNSSRESWERDDNDIDNEDESDKEENDCLISIKKKNLKFKFPYLGNKRYRKDFHNSNIIDVDDYDYEKKFI